MDKHGFTIYFPYKSSIDVMIQRWEAFWSGSGTEASPVASSKPLGKTLQRRATMPTCLGEDETWRPSCCYVELPGGLITG